MAAMSLRKTFKYQLQPTPEQEWQLERVVRLCRRLYNVALEQRISAWQRRGVSVSRYGQEAELKDLRAEMPEYAGLHSHVLQDVLARLDKTYQAFFRRIREGQTPGYPRYHGRDRYNSFTYTEFGNGARLDNGFLILSKIGPSQSAGLVPWRARPRPSRSRARPMAGTSVSPVRRCPASRYPSRGRRRGLISAWKASPPWRMGARSPTRASSGWPS